MRGNDEFRLCGSLYYVVSQLHANECMSWYIYMYIVYEYCDEIEMMNQTDDQHCT